MTDEELAQHHESLETIESDWLCGYMDKHDAEAVADTLLTEIYRLRRLIELSGEAELA